MERRIGSAAFASSPAPWLHGLRGQGKTAPLGARAWFSKAFCAAQSADVVTHLSRQVAELKQRLRETHRQLRDIQLDTVSMLVAAAEAKDPLAERHSMHVAFFAERLAEQFHFSLREAQVLKTAAMLHDIGKIGIPDAILTKPGPLTDEEYQVVKAHPVTGAAILQSAGCLLRELPLVLYHHERYEGGGYPYGLSGEGIPLAARILHVADAVDAMLSPRTYKKSYGLEQTCSELHRGRGTQFDPAIADAAIAWMERRPADFISPAVDKQFALVE